MTQDDPTHVQGYVVQDEKKIVIYDMPETWTEGDVCVVRNLRVEADHVDEVESMLKKEG